MTNNPFETLKKLARIELEKVNDRIIAKMQSASPLIPQIAQHIVNAGGKRLRPLLTIITAKMFGYNKNRHIDLGSCIEFIHTATLLHDDVVDDSNQRRGMETANSIWGNKSSVLVGDFLFTKAFELMVEDGDLRVLDLLSRASSIIAEGEILQMAAERNLDTTIEDYIRIIESKTAYLFAAACATGAIITNQPDPIVDKCFGFGLFLGNSFQIVDDILDMSPEALAGKEYGNDFMNGKITLPFILALKTTDVQEKLFWSRTLVEGKMHKTDLKEATYYLNKHDAFNRTHKVARRFGKQAIDILSTLPQNDFNNALAQLIIFTLNRKF